MLVDSHCHLQSLDQEELPDIMLRAEEAGVGQMLCVCIDMSGFAALSEIIKQYPNVHGSVGIHPNSSETEILRVSEVGQHSMDNKIIALGEMGLDYYRNEVPRKQQHALFSQQIELARAANKPIIVHTRDAKEDTIAIMKESKVESIGGIMHCFVEDMPTAEQAMELNCYISFSGIVTFKNAKDIQEVATNVPLERLLIETDSPYLAPVPHRGKPNEPSMVHLVAKKIAELKQISYEEVVEATTENYLRLFNLQ